jgi:hypothetical protein
MYSGSDLTTLITALNTLTANGFLEYDFNVGEKIPYLNITLSSAQVSLISPILTQQQGYQLINLYYTTDFSPPVNTFIYNMNVGIKTTVDNNASVIASINNTVAYWPTFELTYNSYG